MKKGDRVKILVGGYYWQDKKQYAEMKKYYNLSDKPKGLLYETNDLFVSDIDPSNVGKKGIIDTVIETQGVSQYGIQLDNGNHCSWFYDSQLKLINND